MNLLCLREIGARSFCFFLVREGDKTKLFEDKTHFPEILTCNVVSTCIFLPQLLSNARVNVSCNTFFSSHFL